MYMPALLLMLAFIIYPLIRGFVYSFFKWNGYSQNMTFVGLKNYFSMFRDNFFNIAFWNTILYAFFSTLMQEVLGLAFALLVNSKFRGRTLVRTVIYMPVVISALLIGYMMTSFFQYHYGVINDILQWFGMEPVDWLRDPAKGIVIIILVTGWHYTGSSMIIFMAGLQNIPDMYIEAAKLDGCSGWTMFRRITLPLLSPAVAEYDRWPKNLRFHHFPYKRGTCSKNQFTVYIYNVYVLYLRKSWICFCNWHFSVRVHIRCVLLH